ncbi:MAG: hypothetical protein R2813_12340 [Flavobacteriales bacterium]
MKRKGTFNFILAMVALLLVSASICAQEGPSEDTKPYKNVIKSNPFYTIGGWIPLTYERFIGKSTSIVIGASYITNEPQIISNINKTYDTREGFYINPALRFYLFKNTDSPGGFYASPEVGFIQQTKRIGADTVQVYKEPTDIKDTIYYYTASYPSEKLVTNELQIGATIGYQVVIKKVFVLDIYAGEALGLMSFAGNPNRYYQHLVDAGYSNKRVPIDGARLLAGVKIGIAF